MSSSSISRGHSEVSEQENSGVSEEESADGKTRFASTSQTKATAIENQTQAQFKGNQQDVVCAATAATSAILVLRTVFAVKAIRPAPEPAARASAAASMSVTRLVIMMMEYSSQA